MPVFNYKPRDSNNESSMNMSQKISNYQEAFKEKNMNLKQINYKELDCVKDKIR